MAPPALVSTYAYVNPVVAVFLGWAFAGEPVTGKTLVAAAVIVAGVALSSPRRRRRTGGRRAGAAGEGARADAEANRPRPVSLRC